MLFIHIIFVLLSFISFVARVALSELKPEILTVKIFKIAPHVIDTLLLVSGISLVVRGDWIESGEYNWIISKFMVLLAYIGLGVFTMRSSGARRWAGFAGAIACYGYILSVAITKEGFL
jgi:uncharacterized membrane protein SirB2